MANRYRVEAWSLPLATSTKTVEAVPFITGNFSDPVSAVGRGAITVRGDWDRLADVDDPDNGVSSYYRVFQDNVLIGGFFGHRTSTEMADVGSKIVTIEGAAQGKIMEFARVENFDYPVKPSAEPDWNFGSGAAGGLENGDFEESTGGNDFEDEKLGGWASITGGYFRSNDTGPDVDDADAEAGTFSLFWDPGGVHSGVSKSFTVEGGGTYTFSVFLKSTTTLKRFTMGTDFPPGSSSAGTTNPYIFSSDLFVELDNVARNAAKNGTPGGDTDGLWQPMSITITYPNFDSDPDKNTKRIKVFVLYDHHGGGNGPVARLDTFVASGPGLGLQPWHRTANTSVVTVFEQSTDQVNGGDFSAKVTTVSADHGIAQVVDDLVPGRTYTFEAFVYHTDGSNQNFTMFLKHETGGSTSIATNTVSVPTATWTRITVTGVTDDEDITVVVRKQNASTFYVDDARMYEGQPPTAWGLIEQQLLDDAAVDHIAEAGNLIRDTLGFLDYTSFGALDSDGNAWVPDVVEYRAVRGKRYDQIANDGLGMGFEWQITDTGTGFDLDVYNKYDWSTRTGGIGTDRRGTSVPAIKFGPGVKAGPLISSATGVNRVHTEGEEFQWEVRRDATAIGDYDTREGYEGDVNLLGDTTLGVVADQILDRTVVPTKGIKIVIDPKDNAEVPQPYVDFFPGDTYPINLIGLFVGDKRVVEITTDFTAGTAVWTVEFDQSTYTSDPLKSVVKAVQMLLDRFDELRLPPVVFGEGPDDHEHDKESIPTILVAAWNARLEVQNMADFICNGTDDQVEIQAAIDLLASIGGSIWLSEGDFEVASEIEVKCDIDKSLHIRGLGSEVTQVTHSGTAEGTFKTTGSSVGHSFSDMAITPGPSATTAIWINAPDCRIWNISIRNTSSTGGIFLDGTGQNADRCIVSNIKVLSGNSVSANNVDFLVINGLSQSAANVGLSLQTCNNVIVSGLVSEAGAFQMVNLASCDNVVLDAAVTGADYSFGAVQLEGVTNSDIRVSVVGTSRAVRLRNGSNDNRIHVVAELDGAATDDTHDAVYIEDDSDRNLITGMIRSFDGTHRFRYGVNVFESDCNDNRIMIDVDDIGTADINDSGTGTLIGPGPHEWNLGLPAGRSTDHSIQWDGTNFVLATGDGATAADLDTATGPDASDFWQMVEIDGGDSFVFQQWDDSAAAFIERIEIVGKGAGVTDAGDIKLYDQDGTEIARWDNSVGEWVFLKSVTVDTVSTTAAKPVLQLDQADVDEDYFKFVGTSDTNVDRALVDAADFTTPGSIVGWVKINVQDDQSTDPITDGDYYIPFYGAPSA